MMDKKELIEFIVNDLKKNGPIAYAIERHVLPRTDFLTAHGNQNILTEMIDKLDAKITQNITNGRKSH